MQTTAGRPLRGCEEYPGQNSSRLPREQAHRCQRRCDREWAACEAGPAFRVLFRRHDVQRKALRARSGIDAPRKTKGFSSGNVSSNASAQDLLDPLPCSSLSVFSTQWARSKLFDRVLWPSYTVTPLPKQCAGGLQAGYGEPLRVRALCSAASRASRPEGRGRTRSQVRLVTSWALGGPGGEGRGRGARQAEVSVVPLLLAICA